MAIGVLVLGESGTGKTHSIKGFDPDEVKILSVYKPILPFRASKPYEVVRTPSGREVIKELKNTDKKRIVIDDFQFILGLPMMKRIGEKGWDKFNEIQQPYSDVLEAIGNLPDDVIVYLNSHTERDDDGKTKIKTVGKALDRYITVEGLFMIVLGTQVVDDHYYFVTQNNGSNTLKTPEDMFPSTLIPNDLKYVDDKIRNYYFMDGAKSDAEMAEADAAHKVENVTQGRRGRSARAKKTADAEQTEQEEQPKKTHDEVKSWLVADNAAKVAEHMEAVGKAIDEAFPGQEEVPFDEAMAVADTVPQPELEKVPRRTRKERIAKKDADTAEAVQTDEQGADALDGNMNPPETPEPGIRARRTRRTRG